ncbi:GTPase IMAP family member 4-like [Antennarius striatus]|uniref:GTPase IMAP family member 4-like n=1 Tax=Antennarius striatus TaxID=241820 RepID=UPI0035B26104
MGKSSSGNTLLGGAQAFETRGGGASTAISTISAGLCLRVVDAQGWGSSEESVPAEEEAELMRAVSLCGPGGPHVVLLVIPLLDFTQPEWRALERRMEILTSTVWRHTMVLFTCGDRLRGSVEEHIRSGGPALQLMVKKCHHRYHVFNNKASIKEKLERRMQEVKRDVKEHKRTLWKKNIKEAGMKSKGGTSDGSQEVEPEQVRALLAKVEKVLQENGGWHFSLHMYRKLEEEWSCREKQLRARLEADVGRRELKMENVKVEVKRRSYEEEEEEEEEDGSDGRREKDESPDFNARIMALCCPDGGQRLASCPIRRLA